MNKNSTKNELIKKLGVVLSELFEYYSTKNELLLIRYASAHATLSASLLSEYCCVLMSTVMRVEKMYFENGIVSIHHLQASTDCYSYVCSITEDIHYVNYIHVL